MSLPNFTSFTCSSIPVLSQRYKLKEINKTNPCSFVKPQNKRPSKKCSIKSFAAAPRNMKINFYSNFDYDQHIFAILVIKDKIVSTCFRTYTKNILKMRRKALVKTVDFLTTLDRGRFQGMCCLDNV